MAHEDDAMRDLLNALDEPALLVHRGIIRLANGPARHLFGPRTEGSDVRLILRQPSVLEQVLAGEPGDVDISGIGGFERPWSLRIRKLPDKSLLVRFVDRAPAIAAERMRVDFVANASHELRTPLSTILGYAETLADETDIDSETRMRFADSMRSEAKRMIGLIEDLLNLSRIAADRFVAPSDTVDLAKVARSIAGRLGKDGCPVDIHAADDLPAVRGDEGQLGQLVDNLLTNAWRYGCRGDGDRIDVRIEREGSFLRLAIADHGPGIPAEHLPRLTERFYRVDAARSRASGGTGLGLAIVKHIVERHRGTLDIRSTPGSGTEVIVRLPLAD